jgi:hypothetical protein
MVPASKPGGLPRRAVIAAMSALPAAAGSALVLAAGGCTGGGTGPGRRFFTGHQAAVVADATARIAPGPGDDPAEAGHPGAREADVTGYIDAMLAALDALAGPGPVIFAGGPWSNRHAPGPDRMASFVALDPVTRIAWRRRLADWRQQYARGIATLDRLAGGDFTKATPAEQDRILASQAAGSFRSLLFEHTIEGLYAVPEYGGNRGLAGWQDIGFPGDIQPRGYTAEQVERSDGPDPVDRTPVVTDVLTFLGAV